MRIRTTRPKPGWPGALAGAVCLAAAFGAATPFVQPAVADAPAVPTVVQATRESDPVTSVVGRSVEGRPITLTRVRGAGALRVRVVVIGYVHGNEKAGARVVARLAAAPAIPGVDFLLVPTLNPDVGRRDRRTNARGVDLNRNSPDGWVRSGMGTSRYSGPSPASEPETRSFMALVARVKPDVVLVLHQALNGIDTYGSKNPALGAALARSTGLPLKRFDCGGVCRGTLLGWFNATQPGVGITLELPSSRVLTSKSINRIAAGVRAVLWKPIPAKSG